MISELPPHVYRHTATTGDREMDLNLFSEYFTDNSVCRTIMEQLKEFAGNWGGSMNKTHKRSNKEK